MGQGELDLPMIGNQAAILMRKIFPASLLDG